MKFKNPFKKEEVKGTSSPQVHIVICRLMNDRTPVEALEFDALQIKDDNFNMHVVNEQMKFKEELDRKKHHILEYLYYKMDLADISREARLVMIDKKIKLIEEDITKCTKGKIFDKDPKGNIKLDKEELPIYKKVNKIDLEFDLKHFKVLRNTIENDGDGSYEIINKNGQRELRFLARDGIYHPYFYRSDSDKGTPLTMHPDVGLSRKYYKEIDSKVEQRYLDQRNENNFFSGIKGLLITIALCALVISGVMFNVRGVENIRETDDKLDACRLKCVETATDCGLFYSRLIRDELINRSVDTKVVVPEKKPTKDITDISGKILGT